MSCDKYSCGPDFDNLCKNCLQEIKIADLTKENEKLRFMIDNGLGWDDMKSDGALGDGADR